MRMTIGVMATAAIRASGPGPSQALAESHPGVVACEAPDLGADEDAADARQRKVMTRVGRFAAAAARRVLEAAGWNERREEIGYYLGVGASHGPLAEMARILRVSTDSNGDIDYRKLGEMGLGASNPMFTFQTLNNFTLCAGAMLAGTGGPCGAFYSRGIGTVVALGEAVQALRDGDCAQVLVGGADSALHPATWSEMVRDGYATAGMVPGEGVGLLALAASGGAVSALAASALIDGVRIVSTRGRSLEDALAKVGPRGVDLLVIAPWGPPPRAVLTEFAARVMPQIEVIDVSLTAGETLAAGPALGWVAAVERLAAGVARRALVLSVGLDGDLGIVVLSRGGA